MEETEPGGSNQAREDEDEYFQKEEEALLLENDEQIFLEKHQQRMAENEKVEIEFRAEIKQKTTLPESTIKKLVEKVFGLVMEKESVINARENSIVKYRDLVEFQKGKILQINADDIIHTSENGSIVGDVVKQIDMSKFLIDNDIDSVDELQNKLIELDKFQREIKMHREFFQARQNRQAVRNVQQSDSNQIANLQLHIRKLESENVKLKAYNNENSLVPHRFVDVEKTEKEDEQLSVHSESPSQREIVRDTRHIDTLNDRFGNESGDNEGDYGAKGIQPEYKQPHSSSSKTQYWDKDGHWERVKQERKPHYHTLFDTGVTPEMKMIAFMQQMQTENRLPDPPKYTAEENTTSMEAFKKTFLMKYGRLTQDQQVTLLEANFLGGKALKTFKGIPNADKKSFYSVMNIMADRLRVSREDDSRRAKSEWEKLQRKPGQSVEDYCLVIDEKARRAFARLEASELSSLKSQKLLDAIVDDATMSSLIGVKLHDIPEEEHYEVGREMAIRYERCLKDRERSKKREANSEKKESKPVNWETDGHQQMLSQPKKPFYPKQNQNRNYQQQFNSPSQNYQANPGNNNYQFSSSDTNSQVPPMSNQSSNQVSQPKQLVSENQISAQVQPSQKAEGFPSCVECHQIGCHETNCSKAPKAPKSVTCWKCQAVGHYANNCPNGNNGSGQPSILTQNNVPRLATMDCATNDLSEIKAANAVHYKKGCIAGVDVELLIDSGACISLIPLSIWNQIVGRKGPQWEKRIQKEPPSIPRVIAANNQFIDILFQVQLETDMGPRTRTIPYCIADIHRASIIFGMNNFASMGVRLVIQGDWDHSNSGSSDTSCQETEKVSNGFKGKISDEKLEDYRSVTSVLQGEDSVAVVEVVEKSAKGIAEDSVNMSCCEDQKSDREQRFYTECTHVNLKNIGVCEKHTDPRNSFEVLCCEVETSERDQIVCPLEAQLVDKQQNLQEKKMVNKVIKSFGDLKEIQKELGEQVCEKTKVSAQPALNVGSYYDPKFSKKAKKKGDPPEKFHHENSDEEVRTSEENSDEGKIFTKTSISDRMLIQKDGLQKMGDVAVRGASQMKTRFQQEERFYIEMDPLRHPTVVDNRHPGYLHMGPHGHVHSDITNLKDPPDSLDETNASTRRDMEEPRPRKDPPVHGYLELPRVNRRSRQESTAPVSKPIK